MVVHASNPNTCEVLKGREGEEEGKGERKTERDEKRTEKEKKEQRKRERQQREKKREEEFAYLMVRKIFFLFIPLEAL
jgi:hypothetical protein